MQGFSDKQEWTCSQLVKAGREWKRNFEREWPDRFPARLDGIVFTRGLGGGIKGTASLFLEGCDETFRDLCLEDIPKYPERLKKMDIDAKITKVDTKELIGFMDKSKSSGCELGYVIDVEMTIRVNPQKKAGGAKSSEAEMERRDVRSHDV